MYTIEDCIEIAAPVATLRTALTTRDGFRGWLADDTKVDAAGRFTFSFAQPTETRAVTFTLDHADDRGVAMTCVLEENNPDWLGTKLEIRFSPLADGNTRVDLVHAGYRSKNECYERCVPAWAHFLASLAKYTTTGKGEPFYSKAVAKAVAS